jgi:hypothetical protein
MLLSTLIIAAEEIHGEPVIPPVAVGAVSLGLLLLLLVGLLVFGKGREHA